MYEKPKEMVIGSFVVTKTPLTISSSILSKIMEDFSFPKCVYLRNILIDIGDASRELYVTGFIQSEYCEMDEFNDQIESLVRCCILTSDDCSVTEMYMAVVFNNVKYQFHILYDGGDV